MGSFWQDLKVAARGLRRAPGFTAVAVVTLALGIGVNSALFTVVRAALLRPLPYAQSERLVHLWETTPESNRRQLSHPDFADVRAAAEAGGPLQDVAGYGFWGATYRDRRSGTVEGLSGARVSANFFHTLGVVPALGRSFLPPEDAPGRIRDVVLLSHGLWQRRFGGDPAIVGRPIELSGQPVTVIGVLPRDFHFAPLRDPEVFVTLSPPQVLIERRFTHWMRAVARLRPGATLDQANAQLAAIAVQRAQEDPRWHATSGLVAGPLRDAVVGDLRPLLLGLLAAVVAVLLIACANVANMSLARAAARQAEVDVRRALGASRQRLIRQFLTESVLLSVLGGVAGLAWAGWGVRALLAAVPLDRLQQFPFLKDLRLDLGVVAFTFALCLATGVAFGVLPALRSRTTEESAQSLRAGSRRSTGRNRLRGALVIAEVALAIALVASAAVVTRSLSRLLAVDPGFETSSVLTARLSLPANRYGEATSVQAFWDNLQEKLASIPGVSGVALSDRLPLQGSGNNGTPNVEGRPPAGQQAPVGDLRVVSRDYFGVMGLPLLAGRGFTPGDRAGAPDVVLLNGTLARQLLPGEDPVGKRVTFTFLPGRSFEIVGVVADERIAELDSVASGAVYFPQTQDNSTSMNLLLRTDASAESALRPLREAVEALEPEALLARLATMDRVIADSRSVFARRYTLLLLGSFAGLALLLAAVGIYGVMSYSIGQRTREIGIRRALGADLPEVVGLVLRQGLGWTASGVALGLGLTVVASRWLTPLLFEVRGNDPIALLGATLLLATLAVAACAIPAWRAARVDPNAALRAE